MHRKTAPGAGVVGSPAPAASGGAKPTMSPNVRAWDVAFQE